MANLLRRAGSRIARLLQSTGDPAAVAGEVQVYVKDSAVYGEAVWHPVRQTAIIKTHNETWEWNPTTDVLSQLTLSNQGPAFNGNPYLAMAFDYANGVMVLFGGQTAAGNINQTWVSGPL